MTMSLTMQERLERLDTAIAEGRVIHGFWRREEDGRELVCLLAALSPETAEREKASACPASVMPAWLAELTPHMDDYVSDRYRPELIRRYAALAHRWHVLTADAWQRCEWSSRRVALVEARAHTRDDRAIDVCNRAIVLIDRCLAGDPPTDLEWEAAAEAASAAASAAASLASMSAASLAASAAASLASMSAARAAAWDRMASGILDAIEAERVRCLFP